MFDLVDLAVVGMGLALMAMSVMGMKMSWELVEFYRPVDLDVVVDDIKNYGIDVTDHIGTGGDDRPPIYRALYRLWRARHTGNEDDIIRTAEVAQLELRTAWPTPPPSIFGYHFSTTLAATGTVALVWLLADSTADHVFLVIVWLVGRLGQTLTSIWASRQATSLVACEAALLKVRDQLAKRARARGLAKT